MFLGSPCSCGWAFDQISEDYMFCERCGRTREIRDDGMLISSEPTVSVDRLRSHRDRQTYDKKGIKLNPHTRLEDMQNDRRGAIAAQKAKRKKNEDSNG